MNITTSLELLAEPIGFDIAHSSDKVQAELLNGLARGFKNWVENNKDMQLCYLSQHLKPETKKLILELAEYCKED